MPRFQVYYTRRPTFRPSGEFGTLRLTVTGLHTSHVHLCQIEAISLDDAFCRMQGENWPFAFAQDASPHGEARALLRSLGLGHTSMSVGDVLQDDEGVYWECLDLGWRRLVDDAPGDGRHAEG